VDNGALEGRVDRSRSGIIEWGTNVYRGLARAHEAIDGYGGEKRVVMIAFRVREKGRLRRVWRVMKEMIANGNIKDVL
jgi:hypothetical protein